MDRQLRHLTRLVEELLDVARISQGKIALNTRAGRPERGHRPQRRDRAAAASTRARQRLIVEKSPDSRCGCSGDFARLSQVVVNLLHNAAKYSEEGGPHRAAPGRRTTAMRAIVVRDNGIGIDAALLPRIFDLFAQGDRSLDRSQGGLGVGLTLVRRLVELHGGRIDGVERRRRQGRGVRSHDPVHQRGARDEAASGRGAAGAARRRAAAASSSSTTTRTPPRASRCSCSSKGTK